MLSSSQSSSIDSECTKVTATTSNNSNSTCALILFHQYLNNNNSMAMIINNIYTTEEFFSKWRRTLTEFSKFMKHELGSILSFGLSHVSCWHCGSILVSNTRGANIKPYWWKLFLFNWIQRKHLGKTPMSLWLVSVWITIGLKWNLPFYVGCHSTFQ